MATTQQDMATAGAELRYAVQGQSITYQVVGDRDIVTTETVVSDAIVVPRGGEGYHDTDGRFFTRAIEIEFAVDRLAHDAKELDWIVWDGDTWSVQRVREALGAWNLVAVRQERTEVTGSEQRHERRIATIGTVR